MGRRWFYLVLLVAMIVTGVHFVGEWHAGAPHLSTRMAPPDLPAAPQLPDARLLASILAHNVLDQQRGRAVDAVVGDKHKQRAVDTTWHLLATAVQPLDAPVAVILSGGKMQSLREGDLLPDQTRLALVMADGIIVEEDGKEKHVYLFGRK